MPKIRSILTTTLSATALSFFGGCDTATYLNQTASLGGDVAGSTGQVRVLFINNTPHRAIFTFGTYNNTDQFDQPEFGQRIGFTTGDTLEGNSSTALVTLSCDRVFSVGDSELLRLIDENLDLDVGLLNPEALVEGVAFSAAALGEENASLATEGFAPPVRALLGVDFPCDSIIIVRFEIADVGPAPFRADFEIIPPRINATD
ncbi:MAG: hypothetical protein IID40_04040 [Planctomycetes bacterium]|nr:hypothetical protein [Planctomycetota bacterium]